MKKVQFDGQVAKFYDDSSADRYQAAVLDPTVDFLAEKAGEGRALEFGVGTGRVALPLSARGVEVHGIDISEPMLDQLRKKPGADRVGVTVGSFSEAQVEGPFHLVYLVFNTITNLTTQDEQVACFQNAAAHLEPGGCFVIEIYVPNLRSVPPGTRYLPFDVSPGHVGFDEFTDFSAQISYSHHYWVDGDKARTFSAPYRYVWPSELDLMARISGMTLRERWADWTREPFTDESPSHVSVWEKTSP